MAKEMNKIKLFETIYIMGVLLVILAIIGMATYHEYIYDDLIFLGGILMIGLAYAIGVRI